MRARQTIPVSTDYDDPPYDDPPPQVTDQDIAALGDVTTTIRLLTSNKCKKTVVYLQVITAK